MPEVWQGDDSAEGYSWPYPVALRLVQVDDGGLDAPGPPIPLPVPATQEAGGAEVDDVPADAEVPDVGSEESDRLPPHGVSSGTESPAADVVGLIAAIFDDEARTAERVFLGCENPSADPYAVSHTGDYGIAQINKATWMYWLNERGFQWENEWFIPERNLLMAYTILVDPTSRGWREWSCY